MKELLMHQDAAGYSHMPDEKFICPACVSDEFLRGDLRDQLVGKPCFYCDAKSAADFTVLLDSVAEILASRYEDPANSLPYESKEGGYQGTVYDGYELVYELDEWTERQQIIDDVAAAFSGSAWCDLNYFSLREDERLRFGWENFVDLVKHHTRYLFFQAPATPGSEETIPPGQMLETLGALIDDFEMFSLHPMGREVFRARVHDASETLETAADLGSPPQEAATLPNRMSPAGVSMFYGAYDPLTAFLETVDPGRAAGKKVTIGKFTTKRDLLFLDLTNLPPYPSEFDRERRHLAKPLIFLNKFVNDLTRPVARDGREHIEYVPTQVVTEFFRHKYRTPDNQPLDGVLYSSSRKKAQNAIVLFVSPKQCGPNPDRDPWDPEELLTLVGTKVYDTTVGP